MRSLLIFILLPVICVLPSSIRAQEQAAMTYDVVILGATPAGIFSAVEAARHGKTCLLVERSGHIGGLPANGLGATDLMTRGAVGGLFFEFTQRVEAYYERTYGRSSKQYSDCSQGYRFEPAVAEKIYWELLERETGITVLLHHQFDADPENLELKGNTIKRVRVTGGHRGVAVWVEGKMFVDATYEGDLMAAAGAPYFTGREGNSEYGEPLAGKVYKYWEGPLGEGSTLEGDKAIQAYNYRLCLTRDPGNRIAVTQPVDYNRNDYISLIQDVLTGRHAGKDYFIYLEHSTTEERQLARTRAYRQPPNVPGNPKYIERLFNMTPLPNGKYDANNQERALISSDLPEENWPWPEANWEWRDRFAQRLQSYTRGLLWFAANDEALPEWFRKEVAQWGFAADEYTDNGGFPRQVYVRESRRMKGVYFYTAHDVLPVREGERPPVHPATVTAGHYNIDSHGVRKRESGRAHLDGFLSLETRPFTVPYGVILPQKIGNLISPVAVSGSHLGFSVLRMEPTWMALGQVAGLAASMGIDEGLAVQEIPIRRLQEVLIKEHMVLLYYTDLKPDHPDFAAFQWLGIHGIFDEWKAAPQLRASEEELQDISRIFGINYLEITGRGLTRAALARAIYQLKPDRIGNPEETR